MSYQTALIRRVAATRTAVPPSIETAYDLHVAVLQLAQPAGQAADRGGGAVDDAVDQGVVEVDQGAGEVLAAADQHDVVEVVLEQVAAGGPGEQAAARRDRGDRPAPVHQPGEADAERPGRPWWRR